MNTENTFPTAPSAPNFDAFLLDETSRLELELPNGEPMLMDGQVVAVNLYGPATRQHTRARDAMEKEASRRVLRAMGNAKSKKGEEDDDKEADIRYLCAVTSGFENFPYPGGVEGIYSEPRLKYIANQVRSHLNDLGNFFKGSRTT